MNSAWKYLHPILSRHDMTVPSISLLFVTVCSCVVHKKCHRDVVVQCSGSKQKVCFDL